MDWIRTINHDVGKDTERFVDIVNNNKVLIILVVVVIKNYVNWLISVS